MTYQEKNSIVSIFCSILIFILFSFWVFQINPDRSADIEGTLRYWGLVMVLMIPVQIIIRLFIQIVFTIINWAATKEEQPPFSDELDKLINLKTTRNTLYSFCIVFFGAMGLMAAGAPIATAFYLLFFGFMACALITEISELIYYRKGA